MCYNMWAYRTHIPFTYNVHLSEWMSGALQLTSASSASSQFSSCTMGRGAQLTLFVPLSLTPLICLAFAAPAKTQCYISHATTSLEMDCWHCTYTRNVDQQGYHSSWSGDWEVKTICTVQAAGTIAVVSASSRFSAGGLTGCRL